MTRMVTTDYTEELHKWITSPFSHPHYGEGKRGGVFKADSPIVLRTGGKHRKIRMFSNP